MKKFSAYYYNRAFEWNLGVAINYKKHGGKSFPDTAGVLDIERSQLAHKRDLFWQTNTSVSKTFWGYVTNHQYKIVNSIIDDLVDIVSKNGALLLNIGPKADGTIPEPEEKMLMEIGRWLRINGEVIYNTRHWIVFGEGPTEVVEGTFAESKRRDYTAEDIRFTQGKYGAPVYAILLGWPNAGKSVTIRSLAEGCGPAKIRRVRMLGLRRPLDFTRTPEGLRVVMPKKAPCEHAVSLRITCE